MTLVQNAVSQYIAVDADKAIHCHSCQLTVDPCTVESVTER